MRARPGAARSLLIATVTFLAIAGALPGLAGRAWAQDEPAGRVVVDPTAGTPPSIDPLEQAADGTSAGSGHGITPLVAPVPFKNTQLGWGLALMVGAIHRFDPD